MHKVSAHAVRKGKTIEVTISGELSDSCHQAVVEDFYPGGTRTYVKDPGVAQVFLTDSVKPGSQMCMMVIVPWSTTVEIPDKEHHSVEIYVNNNEILEVEVKDFSKAKFIVIAPIEEDMGGCSIIPEDSFYLAIYKKIYGPASYEDCAKFAASNCGVYNQAATSSTSRTLVSNTRK